ncbi:unnamed protein product [Linum tenue]|uniref:Uncharacterized protein n=1 Tax=Linum tenue TaxID=586396 RepID=A0AAV0R2F4_9ROSI|nr:unnamed protein product [Linum tenue]
MVEFTGCQEEEEGGAVQALRHGREGEVVFKEELSLGQANLLQNHPWLLMMINFFIFLPIQRGYLHYVYNHIFLSIICLGKLVKQ